MSPTEVLIRDSWTADEVVEQIDPYAEFVRFMPEMAEAAKFERENNALSYREVPFLVGSSLLAYNETLNKVEIFTGANIKLQKDIPKHCAEMFALDGMMSWNHQLAALGSEHGRDYGLYKPIGLVSVGTSDQKQIEKVTFEKTPTLHMCPECVKYFSANEMVKGEMPIATFAENLRYFEVHAFEDFQKRQKNTNDEKRIIKSVVKLVNFATWGKHHNTYLEAARSEQSRDSTLVKADIARMAILGIDPRSMMPTAPLSPVVA